MKTSQPFSYPVTPAGLPRNWCTTPPQGNENLLNLTPQEIATTFWLLDSIHIDFAYSINHTHHSRTLSLSSNTPPHLRIAQDPIFQYNYNNPNGLECNIALELWSIAELSNTFHLRFSLSEQNADQLFLLTCDTLPTHRLLDHTTFSLLNRTLPLNLYTLSSEWTGHIHHFNLTTEYYEIAS